ncbi:MAG: DNA repair protein RadA [Candidatus Tectomicrobia bacterium]|uniref:DNA repair protein RadA n=1 Tax=Tectimicrobiota bacterium TaxID=2528274 RepID=A0A932CM99_UNCTE|nr:DNA repair protein RadA [Candidatus Tectomicrobia bacterium]
MSSTKTSYVCQSCGHISPKWMGRCPDCESWDTLVEEREPPPRPSRGLRVSRGQTPIPITQISGEREERFSSGIQELDRVLGGGVVPGSLVLIGGDPGIGKSTLLLQSSGRVSQEGKSVLYITGEESASQTRMRANRLEALADSLYLLTETCLEEIIDHIHQLNPALVVIDSIQTLYTQQLPSAPGSVAQVRETAADLMSLAKSSQVPIFLIGHVTKEGSLAGPRVLEHIVDTVLYFEGDRGHAFRILRAVKNRFGSTNEIGVFEMKEQGLQEVANPSELFLAERPTGVPGSIVVACLEGSRPILVELQALVSSSNLGTARRMVTGLDYNRVSLMIALLEKRMGLHLVGEDIFLNVAGGVKVEEPAIDLGIILAIASSFQDQPIDGKSVAIGEVGLAGEVRAVPQLEMRIREAAKLGFERCLVPYNNSLRSEQELGIHLLPVDSIAGALEVLFS